jgi:acyl-coenzyme A synthetase/AMP-(fatty) acid ligase
VCIVVSRRHQHFLFFYIELASHPHILEVSVVARKHAKWGERPMAFVVLHPGHISKWKGRHAEFERDLKEHAKNRLPGFACPEWVQVVPELPVSIVCIAFSELC